MSEYGKSHSENAVCLFLLQNGWTALHYAAQAQEDVSGLMNKLLVAGGQNVASAQATDLATAETAWQNIKTI